MSRFSIKDRDGILQMPSGMEADGGNPATLTSVLGAVAAIATDGLNSNNYLRSITSPWADIEGATRTGANAKGYDFVQTQPRPAPDATNAPPGGLGASAANINAKKPGQFGVVTPRPDGPKPDIIYTTSGQIVKPAADPITAGSRYQIQSRILDTSLKSSETSFTLASLRP